jgi:hypothetical protein
MPRVQACASPPRWLCLQNSSGVLHVLYARFLHRGRTSLCNIELAVPAIRQQSTAVFCYLTLVKYEHIGLLQESSCQRQELNLSAREVGTAHHCQH